MKKFFALSIGVLMSLGVFAQSEEQAPKVEGYQIHGQIVGEYVGKVYLVKEDGMHGPQTAIDSCEVKEGRFFLKENHLNIL